MKESMEATEKLPKVFKRKWLAALRGGKFKQGKGYLYIAHEELFCCLGVAARVAGVPKEKIDLANFLDEDEGVSCKHVPALLCGDTCNEVVNKLSMMNDGSSPYKRKQSFKQIANYIENNL